MGTVSGWILPFTVLWCSGFVSGWVWGRGTANKKKKQERKWRREAERSWEKLPSGWSRSGGGCDGFVTTSIGKPYWWISRRGKTLIEGPAKTLEEAQQEVERALKEFA